MKRILEKGTVLVQNRIGTGVVLVGSKTFVKTKIKTSIFSLISTELVQYRYGTDIEKKLSDDEIVLTSQKTKYGTVRYGTVRYRYRYF